MGGDTPREGVSGLVLDDGNETGGFCMGESSFWVSLDFWICGGPEEGVEESRWLPKAVDVAISPSSMVTPQILLTPIVC